MASKKQTKKPLDPLTEGNNVFIQTVTFAYLGTVLSIDKDRVLLGDASWVSDTHRFNQFLEKGPSSEAEIEVFPKGMVSRIERATIVHSVSWPHALPDKTI